MDTTSTREQLLQAWRDTSTNIDAAKAKLARAQARLAKATAAAEAAQAEFNNAIAADIAAMEAVTADTRTRYGA